ncbi:hypothetical protein MWU59_03120 [Flavobacteriaceae bacterium F08102]|nr:hypothetical protein [Flavobacteriaceae bacterium F08102]
MQKTCLKCGVKIRGREDKKFCSDYCRNAFNNTLNREAKKLIRNTNNRLRRNYKILKDLNPTGKTKVTRSTLITFNFDFNYFTSIYTTQSKHTYFFVYDQGYLPLENETYLLIRRR